MEILRGTEQSPPVEKDVSVKEVVDLFLDTLESTRPSEGVLKVIRQIRLANDEEFKGKVELLTGSQELDADGIDGLANYFADVAEQQALDPEALTDVITSCESAIWQPRAEA